jgi:nucleotide-binding universal stress UspA family protein
MERRILVPLDGSALAEAILPHAVLVARYTRRTLTLLRVAVSPLMIDPLPGVMPRNNLEAAQAEEAQCYLAAVAERLADTHLPIECIVLVGDPATAIIEYAMQHADGLLIAMATHGRTGARRWVFGSVAERVLHTTPVPLLLVRPPGLGGRSPAPAAVPPADFYQTILVPLDGSTLAEQALAPARSLAKALDAVLVLVGVVPASVEPKRTRADAAAGPAPADATPLAQDLTQIARSLRAEGVPAESLVVAGHPAAGILQASEQIGADLIIMATHGRSGLQQLWLGSVALKVVQGTTLPVLLVRAQALPEREHEPTSGIRISEPGIAPVV